MSHKVKIYIALKVAFFLALFFLFGYYYMYDQMTAFIKGRTTITTRLKDVDELEAPTISVCMNPGLKGSVVKTYGFAKYYDWVYADVNGSTTSEVIESISYILNQDYSLRLDEDFFDTDAKATVLKVGTNVVKKDKYEVEAFVTWQYGICYKIEPKYRFKKEDGKWVINLEIRLNKQLKEVDKPKKVSVFFTSNTTWHGVAFETWPQFRPTGVTLDLDEQDSWKYVLLSRNTLLIAKDGVESTEDCFWNGILKTNCSVKCSPYFSTLPNCNKGSEWNCIEQQLPSDVYTRCVMKKRALKFRAKDSNVKVYNGNNSNGVQIFMYATQQEIEEEVDVITFPELIGSLGGSLGLFFGFSMLSSFIFFIEYLIKF